MAESSEQQPNVLATVIQAVEAHDSAAVEAVIEELHPAEIADLLEALPPTEREPVWDAVADAVRGEVLVELHDEVRENLIEEMAPAELVAAVQDLDTDELAHILDEVPRDAIQDILDSMDRLNRRRLEQALAYPEATAGRLLDAEIITVRADVTVEVVLRYLRRHASIPPHTDGLMVVDKENTFLGVLPLRTLLTAQLEQTVGEIMDREAERVTADAHEHAVALLFEQRDLVSVAVVDQAGKLLGRITVDNIVDVIHEEAGQTLFSLAGLDQEDDLFAPVLPSAARRALWLGINLATAFLAAWVIGLFTATLEKVVALAVLMPVVASMGGIAGSQTLTLAIRGLALGQLSGANARWLVVKELAVGALNGLVWALVVALIALAWFGDWRIGALIAIAMVLNLLAAAFCGVVVPLVLHRLKLDPALSSSVILTTVTDVVGFLSFLGLATLFLL